MIHLLDLPHGRARALVSSAAPVYLSVNPVEYHGPHLSLHNDSVLSLGLLRDLHQGLQERGHDWPLLFAGETESGLDPVRGPGSRYLPFEAGLAATMAACKALLELGARRIVLMTFHGSPLHGLSLLKCADMLVAAGAHVFLPAALLFRNFLRPDGEAFRPVVDFVSDPGAREAMLSRIREDFHAGFLETSLALHYAPETVSGHESIPPCPSTQPNKGFLRMAAWARRAGREELALEMEFVAHATPWYELRPFPGYTGMPALATAEAGSFLARHLVNEAVGPMERALSGEIPFLRPPLMWVPPLTLYGRVGPKKRG